MLTDVAEGVRSYLEMHYLRDVERPHGLPKGGRQKTRPDLPYITDVKYEKYGLIVELDGRLGHEGEGRFRDMNRDNQHALRDELTLRYGYFDVVSRPCPMAYQVFGALIRRGYPDPFLRCTNCLGVPEAQLLSA